MQWSQSRPIIFTPRDISIKFTIIAPSQYIILYAHYCPVLLLNDIEPASLPLFSLIADESGLGLDNDKSATAASSRARCSFTCKW